MEIRNMKQTIFIQNLKCGGCANTIIKKVSALKGISEVEVDNETNSVSFVSQNEEDTLVVKHELNVLGYPSIEASNSLMRKAKSFVSCASGRVNK